MSDSSSLTAGVDPVVYPESPIGERSRQPGLDRFVFFPMLCAYGVVVQFGNAFRFSDEDTSRGVSTILLLILIAIGAMRAFRAMVGERVLWALGLLLFYMLLPSAMSEDPQRAMNQLLSVFGYVLFAAVVSRVRFERVQLNALWMWIAGGLLLSSGLTIVDFAGIIDVPYNNEVTHRTMVGSFEVYQATGFFSRRSSMAAVFVFGITGSLVLALSISSPLRRLYFLAAGGAGVLCLFLTHNRSGVLGSAAIVAVYALLAPRFRGLRRIGIVMAAFVLGVGFVAIVTTYYPDHAAIYLAKLGFIGLAENTWESDYARVDLFLTAVRSLANHPLGNGLTRIPLNYGYSLDPHNIFTLLVWGGGLVALAWLPFFVFTLIRHFGLPRIGRFFARSDLPVERTAISCALFAWLLNGMTHDGVYTGIAWMLFGVTISCRFFECQTRPAPGPQVGADLELAFGSGGSFPRPDPALCGDPTV